MTEMESLSSSSYDNPEPKDLKDTMIYGQVPAKQRSCDAVNTPASCVNKAVYHIQDLEEKMEESFQQYGHLYMFEKSLQSSLDLKSEKVEDSLFSELKAERLLYRKDIQPLKWKTIFVLQEAMELVTRLEDERRAAQEALEAELRRKKKLYQYADALSVWRQRELPIAVQNEWEKSSDEVTEFQCILKSRNMKLQHAVNQLTRIDAANVDIQENIDFMKKYSPLLGEKMSFENDVMEDVKETYRRTKAAYDFVHYQLERTKAEYVEILEEQESRRIYYSNTLRSTEILMNRLTNELLEAEKVTTDIYNKIKEKKEAILRNKELLQKLIKKDSQLKSDIVSFQGKLNRLSEKVTNQGKENEALWNEYTESLEEIRARKASHHSDIQELEDKLNECLQQISDLEKNNKYLQDENKAFLQKFRESSRKKVTYQAEIRVLQKNVRKMEQQLKKVNKDLYSAELAYGEIKAKLEDLEQELLKEKEKFQNLEENVKKQIKDEVSAWKLTQKRIKALNAELDQKKKEFDKLEAKILKKLRKLDQQIAEQQELLRKNKALLKECKKKIALLTKKIEDLNEKEAKILKELSDQKQNLENLLADVKEKFKEVSKLLNELNEKIEKFQKEIMKLSELSEDKHVLLILTEKALGALREKYARIRINEENAQALVDFLYERLDYVEKKIKEDGRAFDELLWTRQKHLKEKKAAFILDLEENLRLAQEYQMLQVRFLDDKNHLLDILDYKVRAEEALRDQKELSQLQTKMHRLLLEYFKLRGLHSQAALAKFQRSSHEDVRKILAVQEDLTETVQQTGVFLTSLTDGTST